MNKTVAFVFVVVSLMALGVVTSTQLGKAQDYIAVTIKADGSIDPSTAPIQRVGDVYTLTDDVGSISVQRNNTILDGNGHTLPGVVSFIDSLGNNVTAKNSGGVFLSHVENVTVKNLTIKGCQVGISLDYSSNITVSGNIITGTFTPVPPFQATAAIYVWSGNSNIVTGNHLANNIYGIVIGEHAEHNVVVGNNITGSSYQGIRLYVSSNNTIYHNNFNNTINAYDCSGDFHEPPSMNTWDNGKEGNFWSDYNGTDADGDGVGDTQYIIDDLNQDHYTLIEPFGAIYPSLSPSPSPSSQSPTPPPSQSPSPSASPTEQPTSSPTSQPPPVPMEALYATAGAVAIAAVAIILAVLRKRKEPSSSSTLKFYLFKREGVLSSEQ